MDRRERRINRLLKEFDRDLFCRRGPDGVYRVIQKVRSWETLDFNGVPVAFPVDRPHHVFSLTHNWSGNGKSAEWGIEPLFQKLRDISLDRRDAMFREVEEQNRKHQESQERKVDSLTEDLAIETRDIYKKSFSDVLTHSMDMTKDVRRKHERKLKWQS
jgi:hypothetical protein